MRLSISICFSPARTNCNESHPSVQQWLNKLHVLECVLLTSCTCKAGAWKQRQHKQAKEAKSAEAGQQTGPEDG
eukprot:364743-Chlamydomonas_euryale.AAC.58